MLILALLSARFLGNVRRKLDLCGDQTSGRHLFRTGRRRAHSAVQRYLSKISYIQFSFFLEEIPVVFVLVSKILLLEQENLEYTEILASET